MNHPVYLSDRKKARGNAPRRSIPVRRILVLLLLLTLLSFGLGYSTDALLTLLERRSHPRPYPETVQSVCETFGVPPAVLYTAMKELSGFDSGKNGPGDKRGLFQMTPEQFRQICQSRFGTDPDPGLLYDPEHSIRAGAAYLCGLYDDYLSWDTVLAVCAAGKEAVDTWLKSPASTDDYGGLLCDKIPERQARRTVARWLGTKEKYETLYTD